MMNSTEKSRNRSTKQQRQGNDVVYQSRQRSNTSLLPPNEPTGPTCNANATPQHESDFSGGKEENTRRLTTAKPQVHTVPSVPASWASITGWALEVESRMSMSGSGGVRLQFDTVMWVGARGSGSFKRGLACWKRSVPGTWDENQM